jgi:hypothetical protein
MSVKSTLSLSVMSLHGEPGGNRTPDLKFRKLPLYPTELQAHISLIQEL